MTENLRVSDAELARAIAPFGWRVARRGRDAVHFRHTSGAIWKTLDGDVTAQSLLALLNDLRRQAPSIEARRTA